MLRRGWRSNRRRNNNRRSNERRSELNRNTVPSLSVAALSRLDGLGLSLSQLRLSRPKETEFFEQSRAAPAGASFAQEQEASISSLRFRYFFFSEAGFGGSGAIFDLI